MSTDARQIGIRFVPNSESVFAGTKTLTRRLSRRKIKL